MKTFYIDIEIIEHVKKQTMFKGKWQIFRVNNPKTIIIKNNFQITVFI